jgi:hypothetical protein
VAAAQERITVEPSGMVSWAEMLQLDQLVAGAPERLEQRVVPIMPGPPPREIGVAPGAPRGSAVPVTPAPPPGPEALGPSLNTGFVALPDDNTAIPPDTMGAAGPSHLMTMLNTQVRIQDKSGGLVSTVSLATFWTGGTGLVGSPFDPRLVYDSVSGRWIATVDADGNSATSEVWFAISATSSPTGSWTFFSLDADAANTTWADFPGFGVNSTWIAITNNMFTVAASPSFVGAKAWVIDKSTALAGGPLTVTVFATSFDTAGGGFGFTLQPAVTFDAAEPTLYVIDNTGFSSGGTFLLRLSRFTGTGPAPVWSVVPGSTFAGTGFFLVISNFSFTQIGAAQSGVPSTCDGGTFNGSACNTTADCDPPSGGKCRRIDTGDPRISGLAVYRNGRLWCAHAGGLPAGGPVNRTAAFWYQIDPATMPAPIVQSGMFDGGSGVHHFYPSIAANMVNDAYVAFSRSDATKFVEAVGAGRFGTDALNTMDALTVLKLGEDSYYKTFTGDRNRWGDYSATVVDPTDDLTFWTVQEYAAPGVGGGPTDDRWGTWWSRVTVPGSATTTTVSTTTATTTTTTSTTTTTATTSTTTTLPPCPNVGGSPAPMTGVGKVLLLYGATGPGGGDDKPKVIKAEFSTGAAFDPDSTHDVHVRLTKTTTGATLFTATLAAGGFWSQPSSAVKKWIYKDPTVPTTVGVKKALLKETPSGSAAYRLKLIGKEATIAGPLAPADGVRIVLEIESAGVGVCFDATLTTCASSAARDLCTP